MVAIKSSRDFVLPLQEAETYFKGQLPCVNLIFLPFRQHSANYRSAAVITAFDTSLITIVAVA